MRTYGNRYTRTIPMATTDSILCALCRKTRLTGICSVSIDVSCTLVCSYPSSYTRFRKFVIEAELNHCRLAMVASIGLIAQEYLTGLPALTAAADWLHLATGLSTSTGDLRSPLEALGSAAQVALDFVQFTYSRISGAFEDPLL